MSLKYPELDSSGRSRGEQATSSAVYQTLLYTVFQKPREIESAGVVVALTASQRGEGVTYVARQLLQELTRSDLASVACVNINFLRRLHEPTLEAIQNSLSKPATRPTADVRGIASLEAPLVVTESRGPWDGSWLYRRECIELLRSEFEYTIIDCPALGESGDLLSVAPFVDGVIVVVEANRTRRAEPVQAEQTITAAGGKLLGYIVNKRTYEVPRWLYQRL